MKIAFELPLNSVSFGQIGTLILRTIYDMEKSGKLDLDFCLFPIGPVDLSSQLITEDFKIWLQQKISKA